MPTNAAHALKSLPLWLAALALTLVAPASAEVDLSRMDSEAQAAKTWYAVNDTVMGGVSKGRVALNADGHLEFTGDLSLKNNGGFASIRSRDTADLLDGNNTINVRLRGDGRMYYLSLRDKDRRMASSHRYPVQTKAGQWMDVSVQLDQFEYTRFGNKRERPELRPGEVIGVGFTLADKKPGPFKLEIASITATHTADAPPQQADDTIVGIAKAAGQFETLLAAAQAAGLADALSDPDANLTVFAPTDDAFAALPEGTVQSLLKADNRQQLVEVLLLHVVQGAMTLDREVTAANGETLNIRSQGPITVGNATVMQADIAASNGIVHIIDRVLLPKAMQATPQGEALRLITSAIRDGVPAYNHGDPEKCADIYEKAVATLASDYRKVLGEYHARTLDVQLLMARNSHDHDANAWTLRAALDFAYEAIESAEDTALQRPMREMQTTSR
jgi:uncharacterized surface protein with fasciclin (FAS1) repeats